MSSTRRRLVWLLILVLVVAAAAVVVKKRRAAAAAGPAPTTAVEQVVELAAADLATVQGGEIASTLRANGTLRPLRQAVVRAKVAGEIVEVAAREGDKVAAGALLAAIDRTEYESRLKERVASLNAARAQSAFAESTRRKNEELLQKKFISGQAYDNAKSGADVAAAQMAALEAQVELARKALTDATVRAPIAGWVAERAVQRGDKTNIDGKLFTVVDLSVLELEALVPANEIARIALGQEFVTRIEGYGERSFAGRVARINPAAFAGNRTVPIYIEIPNADGTLKAGLFAEGRVLLGKREAKALVPTAALRSESGVNYVYVFAGEQIRKLAVEVGLVNEAAATVEILKGVEPGAQVIAANLGNFKDGTRARLGAAKPAAVAPGPTSAAPAAAAR